MVVTAHREALKAIRRFDHLITYLRDELGWPIDRDSLEDVEDLFFDFTPEELGIDPANAAKIQAIRRLRPLSIHQPWGIFFIEFEPKRLPVVALRRILNQVALKKRASANSAERAAWSTDDLLFVSNYGDGAERQISLAHFTPNVSRNELPSLKVLGWDNLDTPLHLDHAAEQLSRLAWPADDAAVTEWRTQWRAAFTLGHREVITTSRELSIRLAQLARAVRDRISTILAIETEDGPLSKLMKAFQEALVHDLDEEGFADMYAQTIAYGLLSARIVNPSGITSGSTATAIPVTNPFLKELMETFLDVGGSNGSTGRGEGLDFDELGVSDVVDLLDDANMEAVVRDFGDKNPQEDPVIHFFEGFLQEYDPKIRKDRGVFYTPRPVVSFIVRSVDELLRTEFELKDGLADTTTWGEMTERHADLRVPDGTSPDSAFVQILDPATGTGTFLVEVIELIYRTMTKKWRREGQMELELPGLWNEYVPNHLLPRLHGYELMMAPYAIAHMKIGLKLIETGYRFGSDERARVYLTNTLEPASDEQLTLDFLPMLAHEARAVNEIKRNVKFTTIIGNPPYAGLSGNLTPQARAIVEPYRSVAGERIRERGALQFEKNLQDDYVKLLAWSERELSSTGFGVLSFISNHGFLETPTLRGMRWNLLQTFDRLQLLDLHGSTKRPRVGDKNVFDIQQGVAISSMARTPSVKTGERTVHLAGLEGGRDEKYMSLQHSGQAEMSWLSIDPLEPLYQFLDLDEGLKAEYDAFIPLTDIMGSYSSGTETGFDRLLVDFSEPELMEKIRGFLDPSTPEVDVEAEYGIKGGTARKLLNDREEFRADFNAHGNEYSRPGMYRIFDRRFYYYKKRYLKTNSEKVMRNLVDPRNRAIVAFRQQSSCGFHHAFVTNMLGDKNAVSLRTREINYYFPLWLLRDPTSIDSGEAQSNVGTGYLRELEACFGDAPAGHTPSSEDAFEYAYAILHSPRYRTKYADFLMSDFPRIPFPGSVGMFINLASLGKELVANHLIESPNIDNFATTFEGPNAPDVERIGWSSGTVWLDALGTSARDGHRATKPGTIGFGGVPENVWDFHIGSFQVCHKWLNDRKGRTLSDHEINHYQRIVVALNETIRIMAEIDEVIDAHGGWPDAFQPS